MRTIITSTNSNNKGQILIIIRGISARDIKDDINYLSGLRNWSKTVRLPAEWKAAIRNSFSYKGKSFGGFEDVQGNKIFYVCIKTKEVAYAKLMERVVGSVKIFINSGQLDSSFLKPVEGLFTTV